MHRTVREAQAAAAHGAARKKDSCFGAQQRRIAAQRGQKKALIAVAHSMAVAVYHILKDKATYRELSEDFFDKLNPSRVLNRLTKRIQNLGFQLQVSPPPVAA